MTEKKYDLSRRKVLGGLGTIGIAGAGAGIGTSALFSDEETFVNNSITAGTLDMEVTGTISAANPEYEAAVEEIVGMSATADGDVVTGFQLADFKPGDWLIVCIDIVVVDNPACIDLAISNTHNDDNGLTEPEENEAGDTSGGDGEGELAQNLRIQLFRNFSGSDPSGLDDAIGSDRTLQQFWDDFAGGARLFPGVTEVSFYAYIYLPQDTGNVVQSDSVQWDATFSAIQARNNEDCDADELV